MIALFFIVGLDASCDEPRLEVLRASGKESGKAAHYVKRGNDLGLSYGFLVRSSFPRSAPSLTGDRERTLGARATQVVSMLTAVWRAV